MSKNPAQGAADAVFEKALQKEGARDPREFYRERLKELRESDPDGYAAAVRYHQESLIPRVASGEVDAVQAWLQYGCELANLVIEGEAVEVDPTGRRRPMEASVPPDHLLLHIPSGKAGRALLVGLPKELSSAQRATYELLVRGRLKLRPSSESSSGGRT